MSFRWAAMVAFWSFVALSAASGTAAARLKEIADFRTSLYSQEQAKARSRGTPVDVSSIQKRVSEKAEEAVKDVDPAKTDPVEALDWAQIFSLAGKPRQEIVVLTGFIAVSSDPQKLYEANTMLLGACWATKDDKRVVETLKTMKPFDPASKVEYAELVVVYAPREIPELGPEPAVALIDSALGAINPVDLTDLLRSRLSMIQNAATERKVDIFDEAGLGQRALAIIESSLKTAPPKLRLHLETTRNRLRLVGSPAPEIKIERGHGAPVSGLEALKGKVVVLDFFAHWCAPCTRAYPDMRKLQSELGPKGLQIVGVTRYYGYLGDPRQRLSPDEEFEKMESFVKEQGITWPVVFGPGTNFTAYGVSAIPHVVVIDRAGVVRKLEIGYSAETFAGFRKQLEELVDQK